MPKCQKNVVSFIDACKKFGVKRVSQVIVCTVVRGIKSGTRDQVGYGTQAKT